MAPPAEPHHDTQADPSPRRDEVIDAQDRFISIWGKMGSSWGIPRTMAEVHALLFIENRPLSSDDVIERLGISRGNVSMTLRSLQDWGIVVKSHNRGDRREYFEAERDVWKMFRTIARERKKREIDPLLDALRECREMTAPANGSPVDDDVIEQHNARLDDMLEFLQLVDAVAERLISPSGDGLQMAQKLVEK